MNLMARDDGKVEISWPAPGDYLKEKDDDIASALAEIDSTVPWLWSEEPYYYSDRVAVTAWRDSGGDEPRTTREDSTDKPVWRCPDCGERYYDSAPQVCSRCGVERKR
jgi:hypothetical protein